jgi:hypothetical protein
MEKVATDALNKAEKANSLVARYTIGSYNYIASLAARKQMNETTGTVLDILSVKRTGYVPCAIHCDYGNPLLQCQQDALKSDQYSIHELKMGSDECRNVIEFFNGQLNTSSVPIAQSLASIASVEKICNPKAAYMYEARRAMMDNPVEALLFHGSHNTPYTTLAKNGVDMRRSSDNNWFGRGIYASRQPEYAYRYCISKNNKITLLVFQCLVGLSEVCTVKQPKGITPVDGCDSVLFQYGGGMDPVPNVSENPKDGAHGYAIYDNTQVYPAYAITFNTL